MSEAESIISVRRLRHTFAPVSGHAAVHALGDIDFSVAPGEFVCMVGPEGCGKSTLLRIVAGLLHPTRGSVRVGAKRVGLVFAEPRLLPWRSILDNVVLPLLAAGLSAPRAGATANTWLERLGLRGFREAFPHELPFDLQQRTNLARALAYEPDLLLLDDPLAALDDWSQADLREQLRQVHDRTRMSTLLMTSGCLEAAQLGDRVLVLGPGPGQVIEEFAVTVPAPRHASDPALLPFAVRARTALEDRLPRGV